MEPVVLVACGHSFCRRCVQTIQSGRHAVCGICRSTDLRYTRNLVLDEVCRSLTVLCPGGLAPGSAQGDQCRWQGPRQDLAAHQAQCQHTVVGCSNQGNPYFYRNRRSIQMNIFGSPEKKIRIYESILLT